MGIGFWHSPLYRRDLSRARSRAGNSLADWGGRGYAGKWAALPEEPREKTADAEPLPRYGPVPRRRGRVAGVPSSARHVPVSDPQPGLVDRYRARVNQRHYVTEQALFTSVVREEHHEDYIEIRQRLDGRLITLVDVVSPANK